MKIEKLYEKLKKEENYRNHQAFITGSSFWGLDNQDSDIDIVIREIYPDLQIEMKGEEKERVKGTDNNYPGYSLRYGKYNLIVLESDDEFNAWRFATILIYKLIKEDKGYEKEYKEFLKIKKNRIFLFDSLCKSYLIGRKENKGEVKSGKASDCESEDMGSNPIIHLK